MDPEAWLCSYFWPKRERAWWLAWRAFNVSYLFSQWMFFFRKKIELMTKFLAGATLNKH